MSLLGIGGSYAHVVVEEIPQQSPVVKDPGYKGPYLLPLSPVSEQHFQLHAQNLAGVVGGTLALRDMCGTAAAHRSRLQYRKAVVVGNKADLREKLQAANEGQLPPVKVSGSVGHRPLFVFTGQGSQWAGCGETLVVWPAHRGAAPKVDGLFQNNQKSVTNLH